MVFNVEKCQAVNFERGRNTDTCEYKTGCKRITTAKTFKHIGARISDTFSWDLSVNTITSAASQGLGMITVILFDAQKIKRTAYITHCRPLSANACEV